MAKSNLGITQFLCSIGWVLSGLLSASAALAANPEPVVVQATFVDPITITEVNALQYGLLQAALANLETVVIAPDSTVTDAAGRVVGGTQAAANLTVTATAALAITIDVTEVSEGTGYTLGTYVCNYNAGTDTACEGGYTETAVASATLLVGVTLTGNGLAAAGAADGSINVTISYQ